MRFNQQCNKRVEKYKPRYITWLQPTQMLAATGADDMLPCTDWMFNCIPGFTQSPVL